MKYKLDDGGGEIECFQRSYNHSYYRIKKERVNEMQARTKNRVNLESWGFVISTGRADNRSPEDPAVDLDV